MKKMRPFLVTKFAIPISACSIIFSLLLLGAMVFFVNDVASALTVYFDLNDDQKWEIISKFKTPLLFALVSLLSFNVITLLICAFYSRRMFSALDTMLRWVDLILVGEERHPLQVGFSSQSESLFRKLQQLQNEFIHTRNLNKSVNSDLKNIEDYLATLHRTDTQPQPLQLQTAPALAVQINELAAQLFPAATDKAQ